MPQHEETSFVVKIVTYTVGIVLGLGVKLAIVNKEKTLTIKEFIAHSLIAFSCAWLVWSILVYYGRLDLANVFSVIVGRYADIILMAIWKQIKKTINDPNSKN